MKLSFLILICCLLGIFKVNAQDALDFGLGAAISVGYQDEWAADLRMGYEHNSWNYLAEYNLFFRRDVTSQNTDTYNEIGLSLNYKLIDFSEIHIFGGLGYVGTNFPLNKKDPGATNLFFKTGNFKNGFQVKFFGFLPFNGRLKLFSEMNFKSFGRRYDTFAFGLLYRIPEN